MSSTLARTAAVIALIVTAGACSGTSTGDAAAPATDVVTVEPSIEADATTTPDSPADPPRGDADRHRDGRDQQSAGGHAGDFVPQVGGHGCRLVGWGRE